MENILKKTNKLLENIRNTMFKIDTFNDLSCSISLFIILFLIYKYNILPKNLDIISYFDNYIFPSALIVIIYVVFFFLPMNKRPKNFIRFLPNFMLYILPIFLLLFYTFSIHFKKYIYCKITLYVINIIIILWCTYDMFYFISRLLINCDKSLPIEIEVKNLDKYKVIYFYHQKYIIILNSEKYYVYTYMPSNYDKVKVFTKSKIFNNYTDARHYIIYLDKIKDFIGKEESKNIKENVQVKPNSSDEIKKSTIKGSNN